MRRPWTVYILRCGDGTLYTGITTDLEARIRRHESGRGAKYVRGRGVAALHHWETCATRSAALRREAQIRRLSRAQKLAMNQLRSHR
ncbi:MAG: GIY-YIG nuclease family protein [Planctomycetes bacterium]|nr:GIY-YIG nuclease family protein [Planctomycetota bacterium]